MAANNLDPKTLARLAIWARWLNPIPRRQKWGGFDSRETLRLMELASAVDRATMLRSLGICMLVMLFCGLFFTGLMGAAIVIFSRASSLSFTGLTLLIAGGGFAVTIGLLLAYLISLEAGPPRSLIESLTVQAGDAELVAKVRRQTFWGYGVAVVAVVLMLLTFWMFGDTLFPFLAQWGWPLYLLNAIWLVIIPIQFFRRPRVIEPADNTTRADAGAQ
jgi:hypothetical protein